jgi:branched-chain amino acid transport system substrate-binding protein
MFDLFRKRLQKLSFFLILVCVVSFFFATAFARGITQHTIVAPLPLSGWIEELGQNSGEAARLAALDVNTWLRQEGRSWRLKLLLQDTEADPGIALERVEHWYSQGVRLFAGPATSGEVWNCLDFANENQALLISHLSSGPGLAVEDDWLFRFCASDTVQGPPLAAIAHEYGVKHLIFVWAGHDWADAVKDAAEDAAYSRGITTHAEIRYNPDPEHANFPGRAEELNHYVDGLTLDGVEPGEIAICIIAFGEMVDFVNAAAGYDLLRDVLWLGNDGGTWSLERSETAKEFAADTGFITPGFRPESGTKSEDVRRRVLDALGREPDQSAYIMYDMIWSLAMAIDQHGYDAEAIRENLPAVADEWTRETSAGGHVELNKYGDRAFADFDYFRFNQDWEWEHIGWYASRSGSFMPVE